MILRQSKPFALVISYIPGVVIVVCRVLNVVAGGVGFQTSEPVGRTLCPVCYVSGECVLRDRRCLLFTIVRSFTFTILYELNAGVIFTVCVLHTICQRG